MLSRRHLSQNRANTTPSRRTTVVRPSANSPRRADPATISKERTRYDDLPPALTTTADSVPEAARSLSDVTARPQVRGKFIFAGDQKLYIRGVTYGTFRPNAASIPYPGEDVVERDFAQIAANGLNAIRTYTVPPRWLLDAAWRHGLYVMAGLPWEQHIAFLDDQDRPRAIETCIREGVRTCSGHPAVLCYAVGNEIPASIVRWHGKERIERFLRRLYRAAKAEDPEALVTYVNYPSTEYLELPFLDVLCFNVYLEQREDLQAYLARLHSLAGDRPLLMAEIGLDSRTHGEDMQATTLDWQVRTVFARGAAGAFVFSWTDEWHRGGHDIEDWDFGLTTRDRKPKLALPTARKAFSEVPVPGTGSWPRISVVVCSYNGSATIADCLDGLGELEYPSFEVIVVDDGSTDETASIARSHGVRVISTANSGLSHARNVGMEAATGEIVAYIDDDARPDPDWLTYLAVTFRDSSHAGVGGPNIPPADDGFIAQCVSDAPGGPIHVMLTDEEAEHIPGCNMAFRRSALQAVGGFDPHFRVAGDDVDLCWRIRERGWTLGFSPAAVVWHHRRNSLRRYWKQQKGYGKAEALLERKWPERYNAAGHLTWGGRIYGGGVTRALRLRPPQIYHGTWGTALFQSVYTPAYGTLTSLPLMPEWYVLTGTLAVVCMLGAVWHPLLLALPLLTVASGTVLLQAGVSAAQSSFRSTAQSRIRGLQLWALTTALHALQPLARLVGRLLYGLTPWRYRGSEGFAVPRHRVSTIWSEQWQSTEAWLQTMHDALRRAGVVVRRGGDFDRWDLEIRGGVLGSVRMLMALEEHGAGKQMARIRSWPRSSPLVVGLILSVGGLATVADVDRARLAAVALLVLTAALVGRTLLEYARAMHAAMRVLGAARRDGVQHLSIPTVEERA